MGLSNKSFGSLIFFSDFMGMFQSNLIK